jgi:GNAT superfamily N-acetyltransferase
MSRVEIIDGYVPGAIGRVAELHATYYHRHWDFGLFFESKVATELSEFLKRLDARRDGFWTASSGGRTEGAIAIDGIHGDRQGAHLRWFIMSDALRGQGVGRRLIDTAIRFCRQAGHKKIYLWTFEGLHPARHLYEERGFALKEAHKGTMWGKEVNEQLFECLLSGEDGEKLKDES